MIMLLAQQQQALTPTLSMMLTDRSEGHLADSTLGGQSALA